MRFERKEDCYLDRETGLEWSLDNCGLMKWDEALEYCVNMEGTWGLPSIKELLTLADHNKHNPATDLPGMLPYNFWSATTHGHYENYAWCVYFYYGDAFNYHKDYSRYVRAVRGRGKAN